MTVYTRQLPFRFEIRDVDGKGDGRTVYGRIVPYGEVTQFIDQYDRNKPKKERWDLGAVAPQTNQSAFARVALSFEHADGFDNTIGYGRHLEERDDGAYGSFRLYKPDAEKAVEMIEESHGGLSVEFEPVRSERDGDIVVRKLVRLRRVGITSDPAYTGAEVLAVRERDPIVTPNLDAALAELARLRELTR